MSSRCKNCGGTLEYDIKLAKVKCQHCDSLYEADAFEDTTAAEEIAAANKYEATMFICPSCGAEIYATEFDVVDYCLYCGTFVTLDKKLTKIKRPSHIIPFSRTKEDCKKAYRDALKYKIYAPSEFRDEKFLDGFKGIYVPYWNFNYKCGPEIKIRGSKDLDRDGDYINVQKYVTKANYSTELDNICYDASSSFDDEISLRIAPFTKEKIKPFNPSYMFGFFGDIADVDKEVYQESSDEEIKEKLWNNIIKEKTLKEGFPSEDIPSSFEKDFNFKSSAHLTMLPVWFLTWRKGDRLAYSVVNGDTGELYTEIPVSITRYLLFSLLTAVPIFFALNACVTFSAFEMLVCAMFLSFFMIMLYVNKLDNIVRRMMHLDDRGFLETHEDAKEASETVTENFVTTTWNELSEFFWDNKLYFIIIILAFAVQPEIPIMAFIITVVGTPIYTIYRLYYNAKFFKGLSVWRDVAGSVFSLILAACVLMWDPAHDVYYYGSAMVCMLGIALAAIGLVSRYNDFLTRPAPHFFRKGDQA